MTIYIEYFFKINLLKLIKILIFPLSTNIKGKYLLVLVSLVFSANNLVFAQTIITEKTHLSVDATSNGQLIISLEGEIWTAKKDGSQLKQLTNNLHSAVGPRWSPNARNFLYSALENDHENIYLTNIETGKTENLSINSNTNTHPSWHPDNQRIVFSSNFENEGFDLWELNTETNLRRQLTKLPGDELEAAWSNDGKDLVFIHRRDDWWSLILRSQNQPDEILLKSKHKIAAPSWRPDGSLITFFKAHSSGIDLEMVILSKTRVFRKYASNENFTLSPVAWVNREIMIYIADGQIKKRLFDSWTPTPFRFQSSIVLSSGMQNTNERPFLEWPNEPKGQFVIRAKRIFDGINPGYQYDKDILISGGRIRSIEENKDWKELIIIDMGDYTIIPGFIDANALLPNDLSETDGPKLLMTGITTIASEHPKQKNLNTIWAGKKMPGPRFLSLEKWQKKQSLNSQDHPTLSFITSKETGIQTGKALSNQIKISRILGLTPEKALHEMGVNAAAAIQTDPYLGRIADGAAADLLFIEGNPLVNTEDAMNIFAIVRNGRFYSISGLIERSNF
ncbi:MAG: hypothetical protein CMO97_02435 [Woeseia sp.]|nr:hypothetical protein [Woeseia sp.]|tara:strand:- start:75 stop:1766 length:1692 start_codon:yes stop_codon:yes gene_type:complete